MLELRCVSWGSYEGQPGVAKSCSRRNFFPADSFPSQRARGSNKINCLARTHEKKTIPPRTKFSFSLEIFILGLKLSFSIENFNPGPCFSAAREGPGMKKPFPIENFIPYWKLDFSILPLQIEFFQSWGPLGWYRAPIFPVRDFLADPGLGRCEGVLHLHGSRSLKEITLQNGSCQMGGREVTGRQNHFFLQKDEWSRSYREINRHPNLPWNFITLWHESITKTIPWELFFVIFEGNCAFKISGKERPFPEITREIRNLSKIIISE